MAMTERRLEGPPMAQPPPPTATPRGFRPTSRRRARIAAGAVLAALGIGGNVLLYTSLDDKIEVLQVRNEIRAGQQVTAEDFRVVEVKIDASVPVVAAADLPLVVNQYSRVYISPGTLMVNSFVQPTPLVTPGQGVVAVEITPTHVPFGLRERSRVLVVVVGDEQSATPLFVTEGRVVERPTDTPDVGGGQRLSVEVSETDAAIVAAGDNVRVALLDPATDPAMEIGR